MGDQSELSTYLVSDNNSRISDHAPFTLGVCKPKGSKYQFSNNVVAETVSDIALAEDVLCLQKFLCASSEHLVGRSYRINVQNVR